MRDFIDNITNLEFRNYVENRIRSSTGNFDYCFPVSFPILYHYKGLKSYVVNNLINEKISISPVGSFNDTYDSTTGICQSDAFYESITRKELESIDQRAKELFPDLPSISNEESIKHLTKNRIMRARFDYSLPDNIGLKASCFSSDNSSILMWSHYADSNRGLCIGYDFNQMDNSNLLKSLIFPVAYIDRPTDVSDLLDDYSEEKCISPIDAAMIISSLCKYHIWNYEKEWRLLLHLKTEKTHYLNLNIGLKPREIIIGQYFFKNLFNAPDTKSKEENYSVMLRLLDYALNHKINFSCCKQKRSSYELVMEAMNLERTIELLEEFHEYGNFAEKHYHVFMMRLFPLNTIID